MNRNPEDLGYIYIDDLPDLDHLKDHVQGLLVALYVTGDVNNMEQSLEEICNELDIEFKADDPKLSKKPDLIDWYLERQREIIDTFNIMNRGEG